MNLKMWKPLLLLIVILTATGCQKDVIVKLCDFTSFLDGWTITQLEIPFEINERDVHFPTAAIGYIVGYNGVIIKTTDKGESWVKLNSGTSIDLMATYFVNPQMGYAAGVETVFRTDDGGQSWEAVAVPDLAFLDLKFFSQQEGLALVKSFTDPERYDYALARTSDGGSTWQLLDLSVHSAYEDLFWYESKVVMPGVNRMLYSSTDWGKTWDSVSTPVPADNNIRNLYLISEDTYVMDGISASYRTTDGGSTWTELKYPFSPGAAFHFSNESEGFHISPIYQFTGGDFLTLQGHWIYQTSDGGLTWTESKSTEDCRLDGVQFFPEPYIGYSVNHHLYRFEKK